MTKICKLCGQEKATSNFYRLAQMADGYRNECRDCYNQKWAPYSNAYGKNYRKTSRGRRISNAAKSSWNKRNKEKLRAHQTVFRALRSGLLVRPETCDWCGDRGKIEGHHTNYSEPLKVLWLCSEKCHKIAHKQERKKRGNSQNV